MDQDAAQKPDILTPDEEAMEAKEAQQAEEGRRRGKVRWLGSWREAGEWAIIRREKN
jgi:muconolactone delta-isomerase